MQSFCMYTYIKVTATTMYSVLGYVLGSVLSILPVVTQSSYILVRKDQYTIISVWTSPSEKGPQHLRTSPSKGRIQDLYNSDPEVCTCNHSWILPLISVRSPALWQFPGCVASFMFLSAFSHGQHFREGICGPGTACLLAKSECTTPHISECPAPCGYLCLTQSA